MVARVTRPCRILTDAGSQGATLVAIHWRAPSTARMAVRYYSLLHGTIPRPYMEEFIKVLG